MAKGIKRELSLEEEVVELDRLLLASVRRNLALAARLCKDAPDGKGRNLLERHLSRHALLPKKGSAAPQKEKIPEANLRLRRFDRYLLVLSDQDLQNIMDLVKSIYRTRKALRPGNTRSGNTKVPDKSGNGNKATGESPGP